VFIIKSQLWATAIITSIPVAMLGVIHCELLPPFMCCVSHGHAHIAAAAEALTHLAVVCSALEF
jgi:hypothetical protein